MSTFNGVVEEFPYIQIDYFRKSDDRRAPLACFLTHVHTDHLQGLESFRSPFIYCSPVTREILLGMEKQPARVNYERSTLEFRQRTYRHLSSLLRPIPLNTPTVIEPKPGHHIRVTLIDANHCPGSVMFLIEGDGKTILYTGDIRAEKWWVDSLVRNPILIPFTMGGERLDKVYLDTTYVRSVGRPLDNFPSKAEAIADLLDIVSRYPSDTVFHFEAWTFGYEEAWLALATSLDTNVHTSLYLMGLFQCLTNSRLHEGAAHAGYRLGNEIHPGCMSLSREGCRIHLCEPPCEFATGPEVISIRPVLKRLNNDLCASIPDVGAGGGAGDVHLHREIQFSNETEAHNFVEACLGRITDQVVTDDIKDKMRERLLADVEVDGGKITLNKFGVMLWGTDMERDLAEVADSLVEQVYLCEVNQVKDDMAIHPSSGVPKRSVIHFPYARHSSYSELCDFLSVFRVQAIHACVIDKSDSWSSHELVQKFFGFVLDWDFRTQLSMTERREQVKTQQDAWVARMFAEEEDSSPHGILVPEVPQRYVDYVSTSSDEDMEPEFGLEESEPYESDSQEELSDFDGEETIGPHEGTIIEIRDEDRLRDVLPREVTGELGRTHFSVQLFDIILDPDDVMALDSEPEDDTFGFNGAGFGYDGAGSGYGNAEFGLDGACSPRRSKHRESNTQEEEEDGAEEKEGEKKDGKGNEQEEGPDDDEDEDEDADDEEDDEDLTDDACAIPLWALGLNSARAMGLMRTSLARRESVPDSVILSLAVPGTTGLTEERLQTLNRVRSLEMTVSERRRARVAAWVADCAALQEEEAALRLTLGPEHQDGSEAEEEEKCE
ncbi:hypothetical protein N7539_007641 [Penicillium diatomitis]|uniref:Metallo-beta-lactamase domain-containing protein n=1 Tax=Penicillium diatomitis TaxID=2819901 RepID=A0A9W9WVV9_9EURO|nr:uncharacterized protein N7539_007641 [Penicillium diatomitis]KAJ5477497.1 hypothetical protein N7539_007641 [Penicillium diatomitis]